MSLFNHCVGESKVSRSSHLRLYIGNHVSFRGLFIGEYEMVVTGVFSLGEDGDGVVSAGDGNTLSVMTCFSILMAGDKCGMVGESCFSSFFETSFILFEDIEDNPDLRRVFGKSTLTCFLDLGKLFFFSIELD